MRRRYIENGINWDWFTEVQFHADGTTTILAHYRLHRDDVAGFPAAIQTGFHLPFELVEGAGRIVKSVRVGASVYPVRNQTYIFDYPHGSVMPRTQGVIETETA